MLYAYKFLFFKDMVCCIPYNGNCLCILSERHAHYLHSHKLCTMMFSHPVIHHHEMVFLREVSWQHVDGRPHQFDGSLFVTYCFLACS